MVEKQVVAREVAQWVSSLALQVQGLVFKSPPCEKPGMAACACDPSIEGTGGVGELADKPSQNRELPVL